MAAQLQDNNKAVKVPESQKVDAAPVIHLQDAFSRKAQSLTPRLYSWIDEPLSIIKFGPNPSTFFGYKSIELRSVQDLATVAYGKGDELTVDFGSHRIGYLSFYLGAEGVNVDAPARLRLTFGEIPLDVAEPLHPCNTWISTSWLPDEIINVDWLPCRVEMPRRYAFRYLKCEILDTSPKFKVRFSNFKVTATSAVSPEVAASVSPLKTRHQDLTDIDKISQLTLRSCMQTVFEDGPRRDRRLWMGDLRLQALANYCTFKDFNSVQRCLYMFAALPRENGSLPACVFERPKLAAASDYIVDYDALFGATVYDYTLASGDHETAKELWSTVLGSMKVALSHLDEESRFSSDKTAAWKFLDWSEGLDTNAGMHGLVLFCCKRINALATIINYPEPYANVAKKMTEAVHSFYDEELQLFVSGSNRQISWISQAWIALSASIPAPSALLALKKAMAHPGAVKPLTPYAYHHVAEALARNGGEEEYLILLRQYWGGMARAGANTFWECFDETNPRRSPYGDVHNNSFCHAWSCTPSYLLRLVLKEFLEMN
jgi:alpha-L-rhamnosidase